jgi:hypothetical protein
MVEAEEKATEKIVPSCSDESCGCETKAIDDVDLKPTEEMAALAERGLRLRDEFGRGGTPVGVARARDIQNRANLSSETVSRMSSFFARHRVDLDAPAADPDHDEYPSAGVIAWLLWGGDPANPDKAGAAWAERKVEEIDRASEKAIEPIEIEKVYEWPKSVRKYRLGIEGLPGDFARVKAEEGEPSADEDIREDEKRTPAMAIASTVSGGLAEVQKTMIAAIQSGEIASTPAKAEGGRNAEIRKILKSLAGLEGKILDDLVASISQAAAGGGSAGMARVNELLSGTGAGKVGSPAVSEALAKAIEKRAGLIAKAVVEDTVKRFVGSLDLTFSIQDEVKRLQTLGDLSPSRAETIARTESANAYHEGQIDAWKESGAVEEKHFLEGSRELVRSAMPSRNDTERSEGSRRRCSDGRGGETITANGKTLTMKVGLDSSRDRPSELPMRLPFQFSEGSDADERHSPQHSRRRGRKDRSDDHDRDDRPRRRGPRLSRYGRDGVREESGRLLQPRLRTADRSKITEPPSIRRRRSTRRSSSLNVRKGFEGRTSRSSSSRLVDQGIVKGISVGFVPTCRRRPQGVAKDVEDYGDDVRKVFSKWKLLEVSVAPLPANATALVSAVRKGLVDRDDGRRWLDFDRTSDDRDRGSEAGSRIERLSRILNATRADDPEGSSR